MIDALQVGDERVVYLVGLNAAGTTGSLVFEVGFRS